MSSRPAPRHKADSASDLSRFLAPRGVAVVGVSNEPSRIGGQALKLLTDFGYAGRIYPVNPKYREVKGITCYPDVAAVPQPCDVALIALSAQHVTTAIEQCGKAGIPYALVLAGGFSEVGAEGATLQAQLAAAANHAGVRVVGPNCLGLMNLKDHARIGFGGTMQLKTLKPGPLAMVTQSGGFGFGVVAMACHFGLGFNYVVSTGNEVDLTALDWMADLVERPDVEIVVAFIEGIKNGRQLRQIGQRAIELGKPILVWKVGNTDIGRQAATSHTARMTAGYELFRAAFRQGGFIEIRDVDDLIDIAKAFRVGKLPAGNRVAVLTLSGGAGVLLADRCIEHGLQLPALTDATAARLREVLVSFASASNPIDATAHGYNDNFASYAQAIREVLADPNIDQVVARVPRGSSARPWSEGLVAALRDTRKPLILNWPTAPDDNGDVREYLEQNNVPCILAPGRAVRALAALSEFAQKRRDFERAGARAAPRTVPRQALNLPAGVGTIGEYRAKAALKRYGIPVVEELLLSPPEVEALTVLPLTFPVAVKIESPDLPHKTEAGAVRLNVPDLAALKQAAREIVAAVTSHHPEARIEGVLVQEMASGLEVIVGAVNDPYFGPTVAFGLGGILTELLHDVTHRFAPFDAETARGMIDEIKGAALLRGYRGKPALDVAALADALARVSLMIADHADRIAEIDINPLFVREAGKGVAAADALIVLKD
ncbi:MAG: acetate--CoA ligase family protein [Betaproteobacteria bacterium]|nr:acetate--CoA ligase family protein [Betaproteobacteria bacterium]MDH3437020.1 acetate--CoA ligase family protein [Betaproteobacteria bacterium]